MSKSVKTYHCQLCQGAFSKPSTLKTHMYTHTGEKPFMCNYPYCSSKFSVISNLRRHMKIHNKGHMEKARNISPQERLYYVNQLVIKTKQEKQEQQESNRVKNAFILPKFDLGLQNSDYLFNSKPELSHTKFYDLYQSFINYDYYDNKSQ